MLLRKLLTGTTVLCLVILVGCGRGEEAAQPQQPPAKPEGKSVDPATAATIQGRVLYQDGQPRRNRIRMAADAVCAQQHEGPVYSQEVRLNDNGTLRYVFVYVKSQALAGYNFPTPTEPVVLDQRGCIYEPHVIGAQTNQDIKILNSDPTTHNIHPVPQNNREWNTSMPPNALCPGGTTAPRPGGQRANSDVLFSAFVAVAENEARGFAATATSKLALPSTPVVMSNDVSSR